MRAALSQFRAQTASSACQSLGKGLHGPQSPRCRVLEISPRPQNGVPSFGCTNVGMKGREGYSRGSQPCPGFPLSWLPTLQRAPTGQLLAFQDFELGRTPVRFISEGAENGKRRRSKRLSQCPAQAGKDGIFQIKTQLAGAQACRESLPTGAAGEGWVCKTGVVWGRQALGGGCPAVAEPGGVTIRPHPPYPD